MFEILLYYPITAILWFWHMVFGTVFGPANAITWVLGLVFLTFSIRAILFKPFVGQVRSMRKMQDVAPEIKKIQKRYANDRQRQAQAMQKLQREHGFNPLGGCLPILIQVPVFIGLIHTLRAFAIHFSRIENGEQGVGNYTFNTEGVRQYMDADLFGSNLGEAIYQTTMGGMPADQAGYHALAIPVAVPLMILAAILTHLTARHSVARQNPAAATQQTAIMNKLMLYIFPVGLLVFGAFLPIGMLIYFLANNGWTLMQQRVVYTRIDRGEEEKKQEKLSKKGNLAPKPGQRPSQAKKRPAGAKPGQQRKPPGGEQRKPQDGKQQQRKPQDGKQRKPQGGQQQQRKPKGTPESGATNGKPQGPGERAQRAKQPGDGTASPADRKPGSGNGAAGSSRRPQKRKPTKKKR